MSSTIGEGDNADERDNDESDDLTVLFDELELADKKENFDKDCSEFDADIDVFVVNSSFKNERDDVDTDELNEKERASSSLHKKLLFTLESLMTLS